MARQLGDVVVAYFKVQDDIFPTTGTGAARKYTVTVVTADKLTDNASVTLQEQGEEVDVTALGDANRVLLAGKGTVGGRIDFFYNLNDNALQRMLTPRTNGMLVIRPIERTPLNAADYEWVVPAVILSREMGAQVNTGVPLALTWRARGDLIVQTQA